MWSSWRSQNRANDAKKHALDQELSSKSTKPPTYPSYSERQKRTNERRPVAFLPRFDLSLRKLRQTWPQVPRLRRWKKLSQKAVKRKVVLCRFFIYIASLEGFKGFYVFIKDFEDFSDCKTVYGSVRKGLFTGLARMLQNSIVIWLEILWVAVNQKRPTTKGPLKKLQVPPRRDFELVWNSCRHCLAESHKESEESGGMNQMNFAAYHFCWSLKTLEVSNVAIGQNPQHLSEHPKSLQ